MDGPEQDPLPDMEVADHLLPQIEIEDEELGSVLRRPSVMVRLITHNLLACHVKGCTSNNFPLALKDVQIELREAEFNPDFVRNILPRLEWVALVDAARQLGDTSLPPEQPEMMDDDLLRNLHHALLEIHIVEGAMMCPNCKHVYPISNGIPNMLLAEHEIG